MTEETKKGFFHGITGRTIIAVILGVIVGLFFGDYCYYLKWVGDLYVTLLQIFVYPYLISALLSGLGRLAPETAMNLLKRGWLIFFTLIVISFVLLWILSSAYPKTPGLTNVMLNPVAPPKFFDLLVSSNIFAALSQNRLPAVIIFCLILAPMLNRVKNSEGLFQILDVISQASIEFWRTLIKIAPYAVFAIVAYTAGTAKLSQLAGASIYLILFFIGTLMLTFWIYPVMIASLIPIKFKELIYHLREPLIIAASTNTPLALPYVHQMASNYFKTQNGDENNREINHVIDTTMIISFSFAYAGGYFVYLFILFAASYFNHPLDRMEQLWLPFLSYVTSIGGYIGSISFLSQWLRLPNETLNLSVSLLPFTRFNTVLVDVMSLATCTLLITAAYLKRLSIRLPLLIFHLILIAIVLFFVTRIGLLFPDPSFNTFYRSKTLELNPNLTKNINIIMAPPLDEAHLERAHHVKDNLRQIQKSGTIRVGYNYNLFPYSYFNNKHQLVGFDVAYMYNLARALNANIEFIPYDSNFLLSDLEANAFDIAIGGLIVSEQRLAHAAFTNPYLQTLPSFIVPAKKQYQFDSVEKVFNMPNVRLGIFAKSALSETIQEIFPEAKIVKLANTEDAFVQALDRNEVDAVFMTRERSQLWVLGHPKYAAVSPSGFSAPLMISYLVPHGAYQFLNFLNYWLKLRENDGFQVENFNYWMLVRPEITAEPRWSILRNVLGWVK